MKIYCEESLRYFDFWGGAEITANYLTFSDLDEIETILEELYPNGMDKSDINDLFWFQDDLIAQWLGYEDFDELMESRTVKDSVVNAIEASFSF